MKLSYEERDGTTVPRLTTEESQAALGPFAAMRDEHLKARKPALRASLLADGALTSHLAETERLRRRWRRPDGAHGGEPESGRGHEVGRPDGLGGEDGRDPGGGALDGDSASWSSPRTGTAVGGRQRKGNGGSGRFARFPRSRAETRRAGTAPHPLPGGRPRRQPTARASARAPARKHPRHRDPSARRGRGGRRRPGGARGARGLRRMGRPRRRVRRIVDQMAGRTRTAEGAADRRGVVRREGRPPSPPSTRRPESSARYGRR